MNPTPGYSKPPAVALQEEHSLPPILRQAAANAQKHRVEKNEGWSRDHLRRLEERNPAPMFASFEVSDGGAVTFYSAAGTPSVFDKPTVVGFRTRHRYAFAISHLASAPSKQFFGTVEVLLAPKLPEKVNGPDCPVPIVFTDRDSLALASGAMVTKVITLEQPDQALPVGMSKSEIIVYDVLEHEDAVEQARQRGRVFMVVRMGDRSLSPDEVIGLTDSATMLVPNAEGTKVLAEKKPLTQAHFQTVGTAKDSEIVAAGFWKRRTASTNCADCGDGYSAPPLARVIQRGCDNCAPCTEVGTPRAPWGCGPRAGNGLPTLSFAPGFQLVPQGAGGMPLDDRYADEYVCDGGDRLLKVTVDSLGALTNLQPGDTIGEFRDRDGRRRFTESNQACIYAPRFVEVRSVQQAGAYERWVKAQPVETVDKWLSVKGTHQANERSLAEGAEFVQTRIRASGMTGLAYSDVFSEVRILHGFDGTKLHHVDITSMGSLWLKNTERFFTAKHVAFARSLTKVDYPVVMASTQTHGLVLTEWKPLELRKVEEKPGKPAQLQLEKTVNVEAAKPGDVVTFVIKYTNVGDETMRNVAIVDALPVRLNYVDGSGASSAEAIFTAQDNEFSSKTLRWEIREPLKGKQSGTVQFKAVVR
jgi:uncharacterized repeat protein (TIGR01451 family)